MTTVVITRTAAQAGALAEAVAGAGFERSIFPAIDIEPAANLGPLRAALGALDRYRLVMFVSPNAIAETFAQLPSEFRGRWPAGTAIAVIGPGSVDALAQRGISPATHTLYSPLPDSGTESAVAPSHPTGGELETRFDSESLFERIDVDALRCATVLIVRGNGGRTWLADRLAERGVRVDQVESYRRSRHIPTSDERREMLRLIETGHPRGGDGDSAATGPIWIVTSSEAIGYLIESLRDIGGERAMAWLKACRWVVPHRRIAENATAAGIARVHLSGSGDRAIVRTLECLGKSPADRRASEPKPLRSAL